MSVAALDPGTDRTARGRPHALGLLAAAAVLFVTCVLSLAIGTEDVGLAAVWHAVVDYTDTGNEWIVRELRIPRTLLGIAVGVALGLSGALIQGVTRNPLALSLIHI